MSLTAQSPTIRRAVVYAVAEILIDKLTYCENLDLYILPEESSAIALSPDIYRIAKNETEKSAKS